MKPYSLLTSLLLAVASFMAQGAASFTPNDQPRGWVGAPALSTYILSSGDGVMFRSSYDLEDWSGNIFANDMSANAQIEVNTPWASGEAAKQIDAQNPDSGRKIVTLKGDGSKIAFRWNSLDAAQQAAIGDSTNGPKILDFIRGDRSNEDPNGIKLRKRGSVLGDVIHSPLLYWRYDSSTARLFFGANDGMLHVLDAATGDEVYAYVPSMLIGSLNKLAANPYSHTYFVDGGMTIANVVLDGSTRTILVGGLGAGGKGLYALDVTTHTPASEAAAAAMIKWELRSTTAGFANLGYTYGTPRLARLKNGTPVVIAGNGYMNGGDGKASLFIIDLDTGALIREISTEVAGNGGPNGLSTPTLVDADNDGRVDYAYAGDLDGNLWKFDLNHSSPNDFGVSRLYATSPAQAITVAPVVRKHPQGGYMVMFATGRMLASGDASDNTVHYVYGIWDGAPANNTTLLSQSFTETTYNSLRVRYLTANSPNWSDGGHKGWKTTLPAGERVVGEYPFYNNGRYYFASTNPTVSNAQPPNGETWLNELDYLSGGESPSLIFDLNGDGVIDAKDKAAGHIVNSKYLGAGIVSQPVLVDTANFSNTLFNTHPDTLISVNDPDDPGVSGGHFDFDIYYGTITASGCTGFSNKKHVHEYDDKYDVTGVNMLNASVIDFNLSKAIPDSSTQFKILVMNQYLNPAATLMIGPNSSHTSVKTYGGLASTTDAEALLASLPTYTRANIGALEFNLPLDAFKAKDWWGDGGAPRAGLIPTQTGCVNKVKSDGSPDKNSRSGPNGERHNGALTLQLIRHDTPASAIELNYAGGGAKYGWRVKQTEFTKYVLAEYTAFWHHDNGFCYGDDGWVANPPEDTSPPGTPQTPAAGSDDPKYGSFRGGASVLSVTTTTNGNTTITETKYSDGSTYVKEETRNADGSITITQKFPDGSTVTTVVPSSNGNVVFGGEEGGATSGRVTWREVVQ